MAEFIGNNVAIPGTRGYGILRYFGPIQGKNGVFGGIELVGSIASSRGKNSGSVDGIQYFKVENPMTGLFLPYERLKAANPQLAVSNRNSIASGPSTPPGTRSGAGSRLSSGKSPASGNFRPMTVKAASFGDLSLKSSNAPGNFSNGSISVSKQRDPMVERRNSGRMTPSNGSYGSLNDTTSLENELSDLRTKYSSVQREMSEKVTILDDLRSTVNEIQPLIEEYEIELAEKEKKLCKQKSDFERAREEWRDSIDLMSTAHQENELYYENQIEELTARIEAAASSEPKEIPANNSGHEELIKLQLSYDDLSMEKMMNEKRLQALVEGKTIELRILQAKLDSMDVAEETPEGTTEKELQEELLKDLQREVQEMKFKCRTLEAELESKKQENSSIIGEFNRVQNDLARKSKEYDSLVEKRLSEQVKTVSIDDTKSLVGQIETLKTQLALKDDLEKTIDELKHELQVRPTFDELVGLQTSLDELDTLHKNEIKSHEDEINRVRTDNKDLHKQLQDALAEQARLLDESVAREKFTNTKKPESFSSGTSPSPRDTNSLPVYIPQTQFDPSSGKDDWCGLCERDGHTSINCPYENDIF